MIIAETPATTKLSVTIFAVVIPDPPPEAVTVTIPAKIGDTSKFVEKLIVPAVPIVEPSCLIIIPEPDPVTLVNPEPSPTKLVAVKTPVTIAP